MDVDQLASHDRYWACFWRKPRNRFSCHERVVYGSPEALVGLKKRLDALQMSPLRENVVTLVVDEVHTVSSW